MESSTLYAPPNVAQVNALAKTDVPSTQPPSTLSQPLMTQEQFNTFMATYEASIGRGSRLSYTGAVNRRVNNRVTCFNCGQRGHYSDTCGNPAVSAFEQQQIQEKIRRARATKVQKRGFDVREETQLTRSGRPTNNPLAHGCNEEMRHPAQEVKPTGEMEFDDEMVDALPPSVPVDMGYDSQKKTVLKGKSTAKSKEKVASALIRWMEGQTPFTITDALNGPSTNLQITLPQLLNCSPRLSRDLAELLRSSVPRVRRKKSTQARRQPPVSSNLFQSAKRFLGYEVLSEARVGGDENVECLYVEAWLDSSKFLMCLWMREQCWI
ncbi:hypothetical protein HOY82DRAFT_537153 [Tuber indicum]|nr:hypothetical protein HOY82DRAFT_537153 [Tuber indicum]